MTTQRSQRNLVRPSHNVTPVAFSTMTWPFLTYVSRFPSTPTAGAIRRRQSRDLSRAEGPVGEGAEGVEVADWHGRDSAVVFDLDSTLRNSLCIRLTGCLAISHRRVLSSSSRYNRASRVVTGGQATLTLSVVFRRRADVDDARDAIRGPGV